MPRDPNAHPAEQARTLELAERIAGWMRAYCEGHDQRGFVVGVSGGIDSAVTSTLAARAGLPLLCLSLPIHQDKDELARARAHIAQLRAAYPNVEAEELDLSADFDRLSGQWAKIDRSGKRALSLVNSRARLRLATLYYFAALHDRLVVGTGNKVEQSGVGFFAKYGDGGMDLAPLAGLWKSEVYALGEALGIDASILAAAPTDGLWPDGRTDEDQIKATYAELEWAMDRRERGTGQDPGSLSDRQREVLRIYDERHAANLHKMMMPPVFGLDREGDPPMPWPEEQDTH